MGSAAMGYGHIIMAIVWLLIIGLGLLLLATLFPKSSSKPADPAEKPRSEPAGSAAQILKQRYARGEITEEQYKRMHHELKQADSYMKGTNDE